MKKTFFHSLNRKLIVLIAVFLVASLTIATTVHYRLQKHEAMNRAEDRIHAYADLFQTNILRALEGGRCQDLPLIVQSMEAPGRYRMVRVLDSDGKVIASTHNLEKGKKLPLPTPTAWEKEKVLLTNSLQGEKVLQDSRAFLNEGKCKQCHEREKKILGYLNVDLTLRPIEARLTNRTRRHFFLAFSISFLLSGAIVFFFARYINRPIMAVSTKMSEVEKGNFDVQIPAKTQDELGRLANSFNLMVQNLKEIRKREEEQQKLLRVMYDDLQKKNQEVNILYYSFLAINRSLQIEEILCKTIENVTEHFNFDRVVLAVFDEKGGLQGKWSIGVDEDLVKQVYIPQEDIQGVLRETYHKKEPVLVKNISIYPVPERRGARKCWEVLACQEETCPNFQKDELRCWMMPGTRCQREMKQDTFEEKIRICGKCLYLNQEVVKGADIVNLLLFGTTSFVSIPLIARDEMLGILLADKQKHSQKEISEGDIKLLMTFISHVSIAIENAVLYGKLERKVDWSQKQLEETNEQLMEKIEELNRVQGFNESILQNLHGGIVSYNREGIITFMNKSGAELLGWKETEVLGQSIHTVFRSSREETSPFWMSPEGNGSFSGEAELLGRKRQKIPVEVFLSPLRDAEGNLTGVTGIFQDITEKKEIEARMRRVDKLASLGQLASGLAHEIKNPLAGIGSAIQVLTSKLHIEDHQQEIVQEILKQINRLDGTIKNLLNFAKPGLPRLVPADLKEIIEAVIFLVSQQINKQNIQTRLDFQNDLPKIRIDAQQIQQALLNVVLNAVEAMPSGGKLTIAAEIKFMPGSAKKERPYVSLLVSDTGIGITKEVKTQIFNPFFTTKRSGTGLGLSITHWIIEQHQGRINVQSEAGKGTSFAIDLPL